VESSGRKSKAGRALEAAAEESGWARGKREKGKKKQREKDGITRGDAGLIRLLVMLVGWPQHTGLACIFLFSRHRNLLTATEKIRGI